MRSAVWALAGVVALLGDGASRAVAQATAVKKDDGDRAGIAAALESLGKAVSARDAKALADHWTAGAEYENLDGVTVKGREALESRFADLFARTPEVSAQIHSDSLRFLSDDAAVTEGSMTVRRGPAEPETRARYRALLLREDGRWRLAELSESPEPGDSIEDLAWLIGKWQSGTGQDAEIETTYSWAPNHKFIRVEFVRKEAGRTLTGLQVIGVDPATETLHTWSFESSGGVGDADWSRDGAHWVLNAVGTLSDGQTLEETNIVRVVDENTFTWQSVNRMLEDDELPDLAPVKITRVVPEK